MLQTSPPHPEHLGLQHCQMAALAQLRQRDPLAQLLLPRTLPQEHLPKPAYLLLRSAKKSLARNPTWKISAFQVDHQRQSFQLPSDQPQNNPNCPVQLPRAAQSEPPHDATCAPVMNDHEEPNPWHGAKPVDAPPQETQRTTSHVDIVRYP